MFRSFRHHHLDLPSRLTGRHSAPGTPGRLATMLARLSHDGQHRHEPPPRTRPRRAFGILPLIALVALLSGGSGFALLAANAGSTGVTVSYQTVSNWGSGYTG